MSEENKPKSKKCQYCGNYEGYYVKGSRQFESLKKGRCCVQDKIVENCDGCEHWRTRGQRSFYRSRDVSKTLYEIVMDLSAIRQILQENQDEDRFNYDNKK